MLFSCGCATEIEKDVNDSRSLLVLHPRYADSRKFHWLNTRGTHLKRGLGYGGTKDAPRLFVDDDMCKCVALSVGLSFEDGDLRPAKDPQDESFGQTNFKIARLDVVGFGNEDALAKRDEADSRTRAMLEGRRKVDKSQFANNEFDREHLLGNTFGGAKANGVDR